MLGRYFAAARASGGRSQALTWTDQIGRQGKTYPMTAGRALDLLEDVKAVEIHLDGQ